MKKKIDVNVIELNEIELKWNVDTGVRIRRSKSKRNAKRLMMGSAI